MGNTICINYNSTPVTTFLGYIKSEESSGGLSAPELEMLNARGGWA